MTAPPVLTFPRQHARTRRFTLGVPRSFTVAPDGTRVAFLRARSGEDPVHDLWVLDVASGVERLVAGADDAGAVLTAEERARRERVREGGAGIVAYATDRAVTRAVFAAGHGVRLARLDGDGVSTLPLRGSVVDPRLDPAGVRLAFVRGGDLVVSALDGSETVLAADADPAVSWGLAEFVAAEEMGRTRGFWWAPDGQRIAAARVDVTPVQRWYVADPANPQRAPEALAYPAATTANADVSLAVLDLAGGRTDVRWDRTALPYLADVIWQDDAPLTLVVQARDQRRLVVLTVDPTTGTTTAVHEQTDAAWVDLVPGLPRWLPGGHLVAATVTDDTCRVSVGGVPISPAGLHVRRVVAVTADAITLTASGTDPTAVAVWRLDPGGARPPTPLTPTAGVHDAEAADLPQRQRAGLPQRRIVVTVSRSLDADNARVTVAGHDVTNLAATPTVMASPTLLRLGARDLCGALLLPTGHRPGDAPLPVLVDPYGGPHAQRVLQRRDLFTVPQWFADQGFAVLVVDGRGSPGRGAAWERTLAGDLAGPPLDDQVDALHAAAAAHPGLFDLGRVAIRGWSFGGYLAALAVLRRPDVFHAAIAGAPVTDMTMYDTHYTERYLGVEPGPAYAQSSLLADAADLTRPLLLIHGLADDNVVAAHTLRLSAALLAAGRPHQVLPLSGVTHMTPQEVVAENLLELQRLFLIAALELRVSDRMSGTARSQESSAQAGAGHQPKTSS